MRANAGFTLLELMIVVAVMAIISAIGYPSYQESVRKAGRADGMVTIMETAQKLERCFTQYGTYDSANCKTKGGVPITSAKGKYRIDVVTTASTFNLTANPLGAQLKDTKCLILSLDNTGKKGATGTDGVKCF